VTTAAAAASLAFTAGCIGCLVYLHLAPTGYSPVRNAVSEYGIGAYSAWYRAQVRCAAVAAVFLALALRHPRGVVVLLLVLAAARFGISLFPVVHQSHVLFGLVAFVSASWAALALTQNEHGLPALGWAMAVCAVGTSVALRSSLRPWLGLIERGFYAAMLTWFVLVSIRLL
jgi:hypothetical membrane protein